MKNTIKNLLVVALILLSSYTSVHAQTYTFGNSYGNGNDMWIANSDRTNNYGHFRAQTGATSFTLTNYANRFALSYLSTFATDFNNIGTEVITFTSVGGITANGNISSGGNIGATGNISCNGNIINLGNVGIGTQTPTSKLQVKNGAIRPFEGNLDASGISFSPNIGGGAGDEAYIRYYVESGENTKLVISTSNDADDDIAFLQAGAERMTIYNGNVGIGTSTPAYKLSVKGAVAANDYNVVTAASMPDYVFANDYKLPSLSETEAYINANKHLPAFKSAKEMEASGYSVVDMDKGLLQTLEETILHNIAQEKEINNLKNEIAQIKALLLKK